MVADPMFFALLVLGPLVFWRLPERWRVQFLVGLSLAYLGFRAPTSTAIVVGWTCLFWWAAPRVLRPGTPFGVRSLVLAIVGFLVAVKHVPELLAGLVTDVEAPFVTPIGVSYYTFKLVHYAVEVKRGRIRAHALTDALAWTTLFPAFTAGPIERFDHFLGQRAEHPSAPMFAEGATRVLQGMVKKFVFADGLLLVLAQKLGSVEHVERFSTPRAWAFVILMHLWAYLDFSAYSDIAIGSARLFGYRLMENFDWPVLATNIASFWKRWHMTLSGWCTTYVYMPLVGWSRNSYLAIYATFMTMGLWHGAAWNWVFWGVWHGTAVVVHGRWKVFKRKRGWHTWMDTGWLGWWGWLPTLLFVSAAAAFTTTTEQGGYAALTLFARLFFFQLP